MEDDIEIEGLDKDTGIDEEEQIDNGWISSGADYSPKAEFKTPILAMELVKKCNEARATEMKQGFWNEKSDKHGNAIRTWIEDQRKVYINSVIALHNFLAAECERDQTFKTFFSDKNEGIQKELDSVEEIYSYNIFEYDNQTGMWKKSDRKIIPQIDEELLVPSPNDQRTLTNVKGAWNFKVNAYYDDLVLIYDEIFKELKKVIYRIKDFKKKSVMG